MKSHSDINLIRHYCNIEHIKIFDSSFHYKRKFNHLSESVFRKYMSRLVEEGFFQYVAKGIYYVGWKMPDNIDEEIEHYFLYGDDYASGIYGGDALLYNLGIIKEKPEITEILSPLVTKNRNVRNYYIKPLNSRCDDTSTLELLELLSIKREFDEDEESAMLMAVAERLKEFKGLERNSFNLYKIDYPRIVYVRLDNYLKSLHIPYEVMQWYGNQIEISNKEGN